MLSPSEKTRFQTALVEWFEAEGKDYPWRRTTDPYAILVSEVMLQQTTRAMVLERGHYTRWMAAFPTPAALAAAPESLLLQLWEGLGYYNRARQLQQAARMIVEKHAGRLPNKVTEILALPGVGRYTAGAVVAFAFDEPAAVVDGNVARVLARLGDYRVEIDSAAGQKQLWAWAGELLPAANARRYTSALIELGQRVCTPGVPSCLLCPVRRWCRAENPAALPIRRPRRAVVRVVEDVMLARRAGAVLLAQEHERRRRGLWKLPAVHGRKTGDLLWQGLYTITHHRVTLRIYDAVGQPPPREDEQWIAERDLATLPMPSPFRRALRAVIGQ
jgi:A/G-specific adenine glycosylase